MIFLLTIFILLCNANFLNPINSPFNISNKQNDIYIHYYDCFEDFPLYEDDLTINICLLYFLNAIAFNQDDVIPIDQNQSICFGENQQFAKNYNLKMINK